MVQAATKKGSKDELGYTIAMLQQRIINERRKLAQLCCRDLSAQVFTQRKKLNKIREILRNKQEEWDETYTIDQAYC